MNTLSGLTPQQLRKAADIQERIQSLQKEIQQILGTNVETAAPETPKARRKRRISAAGRAAIAAAARARWANIQASSQGEPMKEASQKNRQSRFGKGRRKTSPAEKPVQAPKK